MNKIVKNTLILTLITVIAGFLLGAVYEITKDPIAQSQEKTKKEAWQAVFSDVKLDDFKDMSSQQQIKTDSAAISRSQLVLRKTEPSMVCLSFLSVRQQDLV